MRNRTKTIIILSCALGACLTLALGACTENKDRNTTIAALVAEGRNVIVLYEKNGGIVGGDENYDFFDALPAEAVERSGGAKLLAPGDERRQGNNVATSTATRSGYSLVGWYRSCEPRVDADGNPVDDEGNVCYIRRLVTENGVPVKDENGALQYEIVSDAGKTQAFTYSGRWDFENDRLKTSDLHTPEELEEEDYPEGVKLFRLYAAWAPNYTYDFYQNVGGAWTKYDSAIKPAAADSIAVPHWDDATGALDYADVPRYSIPGDKQNGTPDQFFTLTGLYADPECTQPYFEEDEDGATLYAQTIPHHGITDLENGTATGTAVKLYTKWKEGNWYRISTAEQLSRNAAPDGNYEILADLNCSSIVWNFSGYEFTGSFNGNGHTISNIASSQTDASTQRVYGGLFGTLTAEAHLKDITFDHVSFNVEGGARKKRNEQEKDAKFGLFAGEIEKGVTAENLQNVVLSNSAIYIGGYDLISYSGAKEGEEITTFTAGLVAGNLFGQELKDFLDTMLTTEDIGGFAAVHRYTQDDYGRPIYGTTLEVTCDQNEASETYGKLTVKALDSPIAA